MSSRVPCLIAYDISDPARLRKVHAYLRKRALPLQYSVFLGRFTEAELDVLEAELRALIHARRDDVRIYPMPGLQAPVMVGRPVLPEGVLWMAPERVSMNPAAKADPEPPEE